MTVFVKRAESTKSTTRTSNNLCLKWLQHNSFIMKYMIIRKMLGL